MAMMSEKSDAKSSSNGAVLKAEICLPTADPQEDAAFFRDRLGFRLDSIFPADDPTVAVISGHGLRIRLERGATAAPGTLRLTCDDPSMLAAGQTELIAPNGTRIEIHDESAALEIPPTQHAFVVCRRGDDDSWITGRAGMQYRDLVPGRLGGSVIASHIRIPNGGSVADMVHFHRIAFQLIYCFRGWVRVVYEDQGLPLVLNAGDCLIQPPEIRHRVLESSAGAEVIEVTVPAEHLTTIDHELELPTRTEDRGRAFGGQRFCSYSPSEASWQPWRIAGFEASGTGVCEATNGVADVQVVRWRGGEPERVTSHAADILFTFVLAGSMTLSVQGYPPQSLEAGDAFVLPPETQTTYGGCSDDLEFLQASLPGDFATRDHGSH